LKGDCNLVGIDRWVVDINANRERAAEMIHCHVEPPKEFM